MRFLLLLVLLVAGLADDMDDFERMMQEPSDRANWIDPHDMGMLGSRPGPGSCRALEEKQKQCDSDLAKCQNNLEVAKEMAEKDCSELQDLNQKTSAEPDVFLRRFTRHLVNKLQLNPDQDAHLKVEIALDKFKILTLTNFLTPELNTNQVDVDEILTSFIKGVDTYETSPFVDFLKLQLAELLKPMLVVLISISTVYMALLVKWRLSPFKTTLLCGGVSIIWHWFRMYEEVWARKRSTLMKQPPPDCDPSNMGLWQSMLAGVRGISSNVDKCEVWHKEAFVNPIFELNPLMAVVDLLSKLMLHPLKEASGTLGSMFSNLIEEVPLFWKPFVFAFFCILILVVLLLVAGYRLKLPFWIEIGPAPVAVASNANHTQALEQEIKDLRQMLGNLALNTGTEVTSSVEEIKPLGYDCQTASHISQPLPLPPPLPLTPSKKRNRDIILTPVKGRVLSQPDIFHKPATLQQTEDQEDIVDLSIPFKRSDSFPKSPLKNLEVRSCEDPRNTRFEWVTTDEATEKVVEADNPVTLPTGPVPTELPTSDDKIDYLTKVQEIFEATDC